LTNTARAIGAPFFVAAASASLAAMLQFINALI
jgi:hypothetical protein